MTDSFSIYFAGDIFDHKHLVGNALLADQIDRQSNGKYHCVLPQDYEQSHDRVVTIRNQDLRMVIESDLGLFNFDGPDLDSGTVVEFVVAKQLDIPSVILRSDFRLAGDQSRHGDNWNLMCSGYPRTETLQVNAMQIYQEASGENLMQRLDAMYSSLAQRLITALDKARAQTPIGEAEKIMDDLYRWSTKFCGGGMEELLDEPGWLEGILASKRKKGLIK